MKFSTIVATAGIGIYDAIDLYYLSINDLTARTVVYSSLETTTDMVSAEATKLKYIPNILQNP